MEINSTETMINNCYKETLLVQTFPWQMFSAGSASSQCFFHSNPSCITNFSCRLLKTLKCTTGTICLESWQEQCPVFYWETEIYCKQILVSVSHGNIWHCRYAAKQTWSKHVKWVFTTSHSLTISPGSSLNHVNSQAWDTKKQNDKGLTEK